MFLLLPTYIRYMHVPCILAFFESDPTTFVLLCNFAPHQDHFLTHALSMSRNALNDALSPLFPFGHGSITRVRLCPPSPIHCTFAPHQPPPLDICTGYHLSLPNPFAFLLLLLSLFPLPVASLLLTAPLLVFDG